MTEDDVDPENPRPKGLYPRFVANEWHYVPDDLAQTISLGPGGDGEEGQNWVLTYTPEYRDEEDREKVLIRRRYARSTNATSKGKIRRTTPGCTATAPNVISGASRSISSERFRTALATRAIVTAGPTPTVHPSGSRTTCSDTP